VRHIVFVRIMALKIVNRELIRATSRFADVTLARCSLRNWFPSLANLAAVLFKEVLAHQLALRAFSTRCSTSCRGIVSAAALVALAASWVPAYAATKVNPLDAVRTDI
jgi:hypothetical protein